MARRDSVRVGLISDTHGVLRDEALAALRGSDFIVHAGDIGHAGILDALAAIAPITAVRGNNDRDAWADAIPETNVLALAHGSILVIHDIAQLGVDPHESGHRAVVSGHSHRPAIVERSGVVHVNPGSAGPRRFSLPVCVGELIVDAGGVRARLIELDVAIHAAPLPDARTGAQSRFPRRGARG